MTKWLSVVGIGEDGLAGLSPVARSYLDAATTIIGGERHLAMLNRTDAREKLVWRSPIAASIAEILDRRGQSVCVLASGDPMCYGIGVTLIQRIDLAEMTIVPGPSAFSLACARLGWPLIDVEQLSLCGRDPALINAVLYSRARILVLSADRRTPAIVAQQLVDRGLGEARITVLERMGNPDERQIEGTAATWSNPDLADLNTIAIALPKFPSFSRVPGLPDTAFHHDGQLTKREVRAMTLAALAPIPGQRLWDVGAGCGSIAIEWLRSDRRCQAIAIEMNADRRQLIAENAIALGVPNLTIVAGKAPDALNGLPAPDTVFIGGGLTAAGVFETCWSALRPGGRLAANAVTVESEQCLFQWQREWGGSLTRIAIQRAEPVGQFLGWKAMAPITQWQITKE